MKLYRRIEIHVFPEEPMEFQVFWMPDGRHSFTHRFYTWLGVLRLLGTFLSNPDYEVPSITVRRHS